MYTYDIKKYIVNDDSSDSLYYYPAVTRYSFSTRTYNEQRALEQGHIQPRIACTIS
jgi:hypothetical protein